ncbi:MAG: hypothetical protein AB7J35_01680 [Dehalococcoidia bacterium]
MTQQPSRVIYLPPGVVPPQPVQQSPAIVPSGIPFDRAFFEQIIPPAVAGFCKQVGCNVPVLELMTVDGVTHYVNGISGVADQWVALQTSLPDHPHPVQTFIPYQTIFRVEIHPEADERRAHLGFITDNVQSTPQVEPPKPTAARAPAAKPRRTSTTKKS